MAIRRLALALIAAFAAGSAFVHAQLPGQNINMVSGKTLPYGDPYLQKQNEPSGAVSTRNPCRLLAGANDYRTVNLPGLPADKENGDAWVGWYTSINCGQTWSSTLMPGFPQDTTTVGKASPVYGLSTAADPTVRAGAGGFFGYSFIAYNRGTNVGKVAVARFLDRNTNETIKTPDAAISYVDTKTWDTGSAGNFIDKPTLTLSPGIGTCSITTAAGKTSTIPATTVHLAWTVFVGNNDDVIRTKVYYARSSNCGATLDGPATKLSEGYAISQSASVAVAPTGAIYVVWRQFSSPKGDVNQLLVAKSIDGGKSFTKASPIPMPQGFVPVDQGTSSKTFRVNTFPSTATDQWGRLYVAAAVRGYVPGDPDRGRVVIMNTLDGITWNGPVAIDNPPNTPGHQIMPAITSVGGKLNAVWLDFHDDVSTKFGFGAFDFFIKEIYPIRHTMDVRGAQATLNATGALAWSKYGIIQAADPLATVNRISKYLIGDYEDPNGDSHLKQLQFNRPLLKLYGGGTKAFIGDFIDVAGLAYLAQQNGLTTTWLPNNGTIPALDTTAAQTFYAFWTDNRDAKVSTFPAELDSDTEGPALPYIAPGPGCSGTNPPTQTRNANVYMSRITPGLFVAAPTNSKPSLLPGSTNRIVRAFPVLVQNNTGGQPKTFTLTIVPPAGFPTSDIATFEPIPQNPIPSPLPAKPTLVVTIPPKSSITRTVFVLSSIKYPQIRVTVTENGSVTPLTGAAIINADIENADIENADIENADIENSELHNADIENADIENADIENADIENADIENADIENADIENADIENADIENADIENADIENADIENADIENADIENADIENGAMNDFSVEFTNEGNTASSYQVKFAVGGNTSGYIFQLIGHRIYRTPSADGCKQTLKKENQILFNITDPDISPTVLPNPTSAAAGGVGNATILVAPREKLKVTLRAFDKDGVTITNPAKAGGGNGSIQPFCPIVDTNGANCTAVTNPITILVKAAAPDTGTNVAFEEVVTTNPAGAVNITTTTLPQATAGSAYSQQLQAVGGLGSYTWTLDSGAVPAGTSLSSAGVLSGTPTTAGSYNFVVKATDGIQSDTQALTVQVVASITTASVPGAIVSSLYGPRTLQQAGLSGPVTWSVQSGSLPPGVTLNSTTGVLGGIATTPGVSNFVVQAQAGANSATKAFAITAMTIGAGDLIVADGAILTTAGRLLSVSPGGAVQTIASISGMPHAVAQDGNSFVVLDRTNNDVLRVTPGNVERLYDGPANAGFIAVAVNHGGDIFIGDNAADRVYKLSGGTLTTLGNLPSSPSELQGIDMVVEPSGGLMVADDTAAGAVQLVHFDAAGVQAPTVAVDLASSGGIVVHSSGDFLIADYTAAQVFRVTAAGGIISSIAVAGIGTMTGLAEDFDGSFYASTRGTAAVQHIGAAGGFTTVASGIPPFFSTELNDLVQFRPVNRFESFVDGTPACASCPITNQFAPLGTTFSFVTLIPNTGVTNVQLIGGHSFDHPSDGNPNHSVTAPALATGGFYNGTMTIATPGQPRTVTFRIQGNNSVTSFPVSAVDAQNNAIQPQRRNVYTYGAGNLTAREETIVITAPAGIASIDLGMPVGLVFVDNFVIKP